MRVKSINTIITFVIAILISLSVLVGVWWVSNDTYEAISSEEKVAMDNVVKQAMAALDGYIAQNEDMVRMLASQQSVREALEGRDPLDASYLFRDLLENSNGYWAAFVFDKNGMVVAGYNAKGKNMAGADRSSRGYVKAILSGKEKVHISDNILISKSGGGIMIFAAACVVYDHAGEILGGVGLFPKWESFTSKFIDPFRVAGQGYGYMLDSKGRIIAHAVNKKLFLKDLSKYDFVQTALREKNGDTVYEWEGRDKYMKFADQPKTGWIMVMSAYESDMAEPALHQRNYLAIGGACLALLLIGIMIFFIRLLVTRPVKGILGYASDVAKGDLNSQLEGTYRYEFEALAQQIELMVAELKTKLGFSEGVLNGLTLPCSLLGPDYTLLWVNQYMLDLIEKEGEPEEFVGLNSGEFYYDDPQRETLSNRAIREKQQLETEIEYAVASGGIKNIHVVATPFYDMDGELLGSLAIWIDMTEIRSQQKLIEEQNDRISRAASEAEEISQNLSSTAEELSAQIEQATRGADLQGERTAETATAMEEMNATVLEVARSASQAAEDSDQAKEDAQHGEQIVGQVIDAVGDVQAQADNLKVSMEELGNQAAGIGKILEVITDIADQTNLLALNAAIEAARAGEAGRGFAVVADEVRKLAEKTMDATGEVGEAIGKIQTMTQGNVAATDAAVTSVSRSTDLAEESGQALKNIVIRVENAVDQVRAIATASEEQSATSEEINRATDEVNRISQETSQVMVEASGAIRDVAEMASRLNSVIEEMASHS